ncbi:MAG: hypothetical protein IKZ53_03815, partial [Selenomonadaceae bacterium]|nr:hypothetical protein [Selenomonadaceae bacterium]
VHIANFFSVKRLQYQQLLSFRNIQQKVCLSNAHSIIAWFSLGLCGATVAVPVLVNRIDRSDIL